MTSTLSQQSFTDAAGSADAWLGAARLTFRQGEEIYAQDEDADLIYRLVRGAVRTSHLLADGRRQIGDFYYVDRRHPSLFGRGARRLRSPRHAPERVGRL